MQKSIITLTMNPAIDVSTSVDQVVPERKLRCTPPAYEPGGGGINVARAVKRLGGEARAIYVTGGPTGQTFQKLLDDEGIDHTPLWTSGTTRENFIVLDESSGEQYRFGMPGAVLQENDWKRCLADLASWNPKPDYLVASGSLPPGAPPDFYAQVVQTGKELDSRVIVDTSGEALKAVAGAGPYLLKPNLNELQTLAGEEFRNEVQIEEAARGVIRQGICQVLVVSLGAAGAILVTRDIFERFRTPTVKIKSKVGAGDSMVAGIVLSLARGKSLREALLYGVSAGAATVSTPGTELCNQADTERLYNHLLSHHPPS